MSAMRGTLLKVGAIALAGAACIAWPAAAEDVVISHARGQAVLPGAPSRVAVYDLATLDILGALGLDVVAGVPKGAEGKGNFPPHMAGYGAAKYANVGTLFEPDLAALRSLKPDLIVVGGRSSKKYDEVSLIAPTIDVASSDKDLAAVAIAATRRLGAIFGASDRAEDRIAGFEAVLADLHAQGAKAGTGVLLFAAGQGVSVQAPGDRFGHVYEFVGIRSAVPPAVPAASGPRPEAGSPEAEAARDRQRQVLDAALAADPTWLLVIDRNAATGSAPSTIAAKLAGDERIASSAAWKAGRVIYLDPKTWYLVGAGIDALSASAADTLAALRAGGR